MALGASHRLQDGISAVETMTRFAFAVLALASGVYTYLGVRSILDGSATAVFFAAPVVDFFAPAAPALRAAPWIAVRGNHEICKRAGAGYFRLLDPRPAQAPPCVELVPPFTVTVGGQSFIVFDSSYATDKCPCDSGRYAEQFKAMRPAPNSWLLTHRPVWGFRSDRKTINATLQQALAGSDGKLPDGITLILAGHIHLAEVLSFADKRTPQFVLGTGGTLLARKIKRSLTGARIAGTTVSYGRTDHRFGFAILKPAADN